ncbi:alpha/beta fold hydrolase [Luteibacter sp. PPL552]
MRIPVIYVHGFIGHLRFAELSTGLDPDDVWMPDLLGFGTYGYADPGRMSVAHQAEHLATWIERHVGLDPAIVVGHSAGAAVVMRYAREHPERIAALVSAEGNLAPSDAFLSSRLAPMAPADVVRWLAQTRQSPGSLMTSDACRLNDAALDRLKEWLDHQPAEVIHAAARAALLETLRPAYVSDVAEVMATIPTFLMRGERTPPGLGVTPRVNELAQASFTIPDAGHAMVLENPEGVGRAVAEVVAWVRRRPAR